MKKKKLPNYRRVPFDAEMLQKAIDKSGIPQGELEDKIGVAHWYLRDAICRGAINPAALIELKNYIHFRLYEICPDFALERVYNGHGTKSGRMQVDWDALDEIIKQEGYTYERLGKMLGHSSGYLRTARAVGGLSADMITKLAEILSIDPITLTDYIEPHAANVIYLVNSQHYK